MMFLMGMMTYTKTLIDSFLPFIIIVSRGKEDNRCFL